MAPRKPKKDMDGDDDMLEGAALSAGKALEKAGVWKALLLPASKVLGDFMGKRTQEWVDGLDERRAKNVEAHYAKMKTIEHIDPPKNGPTERQFTALVEWTAEAQTVDPEAEPELAALWQSLLGDIYRNDPYADELASILKNMTRADARMFLNGRYHRKPFILFREMDRNDIGPPYIERFKQWGLISRRMAVERITLILAVSFVGGTSGLLASRAPYFKALLFPSSESASGLWTWSLAVTIASLLAIFMSTFIMDIARMELTPLGRRLYYSGRRYLDAPTPPIAQPEPPEPAKPAPRARRTKKT
ncbi:hypothetical protein [Rhizobium sp. Rhizsp82]|uniref:hypothetical protein n=1 Tax=Rhizobium sp. Rhizsp82 TaxID=3243057 RepID=UPI0039B44E41